MNLNSKSAPFIPHLNSKYATETLKSGLNEAFLNNTPFSENGLEFLNEPFKCCHLTNFIEEDDYLELLRNELLDIELYEKNNDLYKFHQSADFKSITSSNISSLKTFIYEVFRIWVQNVTGIKLNTTMDLNCARYDYTDVLLCHDDKLGSRKIAYILYLVPKWEDADGGLLDLFDVDENNEPKNIVKSLVPQWNSFVFFEVTDKSFHQVSEILSQDKTRLSISGWFHGDVTEPLGSFSASLLRLIPAKQSHILIDDWINASYLDTDAQFEIRKKFEEDSEVELRGILNKRKYTEVIAAIQQTKIEWEKIGPPNKRNYEVCRHSSLTPILSDLLELFQSEEIFLFLSNVTGLKLHKSAKTDDSDEDDGDERSSSEDEHVNKKQKLDERLSEGARCCCNLRRWNHGSYTLLHDGDDELNGYALDLFLFLDCKDWDSKYGGYISYIAKDEDEELLTVSPEENALALVFRDKETLRFVKHINHQCNLLEEKSRFFSLFGVYTE